MWGMVGFKNLTPEVNVADAPRCVAEYLEGCVMSYEYANIAVWKGEMDCDYAQTTIGTHGVPIEQYFITE
jgi:hypothetical protein